MDFDHDYDADDHNSENEEVTPRRPSQPLLDPNDSKIPAPAGQPGRPNSGGFNIPEALGWELQRVIQLKVNPLLCLSFSSTDLYVAEVGL